MKSAVELNRFLSKFFYITWFAVSPSGRLANEAFTSNFTVSLKQWLNILKIRNCDSITPNEHETTEVITRKAKNAMVRNLNFSEEETDIDLDKCHQFGPTIAQKQSTKVK